MRTLTLASTVLLLLSLASAAQTVTPREAADQHYAHVLADDEAAWAKTFTQSDYELYQRAQENGIKGHALEGRWRSARRRASKGFTWRFLRTEKELPDKVKLFYSRLNSKGKKEGYPLPITLVRENDKWVVESVTY